MAPMVASAWARELWAPDEPRYAEVAREIYDGGSFLVMHLCGQIYPDKPPLLFWLAGFFGWLSDWSELWMRLPSLAATFGTAALVARVARRWWSSTAAPLAAAVYLSTVMVTEIGGRLQIDPLLAFLCLLALDLIDRPADSRRQRALYVLAAGLTVGIGGLAKGPLAIVNVGLVLAAWRWLGPRRSGPRAGRLVWSGAAVLAVAPMAAWALLASAVEPALFRELFFGQHAGRITHADRHPGPPWKHLLRMPLLLLPWTGAVIGGLIAGLRGIRHRKEADVDDGTVRAALWFGALVVFFSLIPPKRDLYLLFAYPAAALLAAAYLERRAGEKHTSRWITLPGPVVLLVVGAAMAVAPAFIDVLPGLGWRGPVVGVTTAAAAIGALIALKKSGLHAWSNALLVAWWLFATLTAALVFPVVNTVKSTRGPAAEIVARDQRPTEIPCLGVRPEGFRFYGDGKLPAVPGEGLDLEAVIEREGTDFLALVSVATWNEIAPTLGTGIRVLSEEQVGDKDFVLIGAAPDDGNH